MTGFWHILFKVYVFKILVQCEFLRPNHRSVSKNIYPVGTGIQELFYIPEYVDGLFFSVVFDIFFDGVGQRTVFVRECV